MFEPAVYECRRATLRHRMAQGLILLIGHENIPMDFRANVYPFRQDSCFRYFFGLDRPGLVGLLDAESGEEWLFGDDPGIDATIWLGAHETIAEGARRVGVTNTGPRSALVDHLDRARRQARPIHFPPPYRADTERSLDAFLGAGANKTASNVLCHTIIALREIKEPGEIAEMEAGLAVTRRIHHAAMELTRPGVHEQHIVGQLEGIAREAGLRMAYETVFTSRGEILHNLSHDRILAEGDLVVHDAGVWSPGGYATDITRTIAVSGTFDPLQAVLYDAVLEAQTWAIEACRPGARFLDIHLGAARILIDHLIELGLYRGNAERVITSGAYALCFQCGVGHQIGLDVHDMEALGEDLVGYDEATMRSDLFGLRNLRLGKTLKQDMTVTIEPGLYFIPQLIAMWRGQGRHADMIDYDRFEQFGAFGGIRIEDDIIITSGGSRVLGDPVDKTREEIGRRCPSVESSLVLQN